jgi:hypothetical protein
MSFIIFTPDQVALLLVGQIKEKEVGSECSTYDKDEKCIQSFCRKT